MAIYEEYAREKTADTKRLAKNYYTLLPWYMKLFVGLFRKPIRLIASRSLSLAYERGVINSYAMHEIDGIQQRLLGK